MAKTKIVVAVLLCMVGFFLVTSCSKPKHILRIDVGESGLKSVDVADWIFDQVDSIHDFTLKDEKVSIIAFYMEPAGGMPTYPTVPSVHLAKYTIEWKDIQSGAPVAIPTTYGAMDQVVLSDLDQKNGQVVPVLLMPANSKDTCILLQDLRADPDGEVFYNGQLLVKAKITVEGTDMLTDEEVKAETHVTIAIADYYDQGQGRWGQ